MTGRDDMLAKILAAASIVNPDLYVGDNNEAHAMGKSLGEELAAMICTRIAPPYTLLAAFGIASRGDFRLVMGMCEGVETALKAFSAGTEVLQ